MTHTLTTDDHGWLCACGWRPDPTAKLPVGVIRRHIKKAVGA